MTNKPTPLRPLGINTVPFGTPTAVAAALVSLHLAHPKEMEEVDLWLACGGQAGDTTISFPGSGSSVTLVHTNSGTAVPVRVFHNQPFRNLQISATGSGPGVGLVTGEVRRHTVHRPFQPSLTAVPTGIPVALSNAVVTTVHKFDPGSIDEMHLWLNNTTAGALTDASVSVVDSSSNAAKVFTGVSVPAKTSLKLIDGVQFRGDATSMVTMTAAGDAGHSLFGYIIRR